MEEKIVVNSYEPLIVSLRIKASRRIVKPTVYLVFYDKEQRGFAEVNNFNESNLKLSFEAGNTYNLQVLFKELHFAQGIYSLTVALGEDAEGAREIIFRNQSALVFQVHSRHHGWVPIQYLPEWQMT
jgi:hypothetical protein